MTGAGFPDPMPAAAFTGPIGETVLALEAQVETCREALLAETLVFFGNVLGRTAHVRVARTHHYANEFVVLVGQSSRSRKGTVRDVAVDLVGFADPVWQERGVLSGATSGEGIIAAVRDPTRKRRRANRKEKADADLAAQIDSEGYLVEVLDEGVEDKRAVFDEAELSSVFKVALREGNTLSERFRKFYDKGSDQITNKNSPMRATAAHVSINGHITREELRARLTELDSANGWANRFVYVATRRVRRLPGHVIGDFDLAELAQPLGEAIVWARASEPELAWEESAWKDWCRFYAAVPDDVHGIAGALAARAEAHVLRFAIIYAVAERSSEITFAHLDAALAVWDYCERSIAWAWDGMIGNADADRIVEGLLVAGESGLSRTAVRDLFSHDRKAAAIDVALALLRDAGVAVRGLVETGGRPAEWWWHRDFARDAPPGPNRTERTERGERGDFGPFGPVPSRSGQFESDGGDDA
jgi:hypothetical protein